ncbi:MAG TPA: hypothetical protein VGQ67_08325 [Candidatus Polarisedimenticolia bacterium]|nr:hypothetical protein [Candidatus Polarisedimenticolia bacterium]
MLYSRAPGDDAARTIMPHFFPALLASRRPATALLLLGLVASAAGQVSSGAHAAPAATSGPSSELRFTADERAILECLRAGLPKTVSVGSGLLSTDLTFLDPSNLVLHDGTATFKVRVKGRTMPIDQVLNPIVRLERDSRSGQYFGVISSLPISLPGLGTMDLSQSIPRIEIPEVLDNLWQLPDKPLALRLRIRRIAILEHLVDVGADVEFAPVANSAPAHTSSRERP